MSEPESYPFTQERIDQQARANVNVLILGSIAYAKAKGHGGHDWATFMGQTLAPTWAARATPREVAESLALNLASFGMQVVSVTGDEMRGEMITSDWPGSEMLTFFGLTQAEADTNWELVAPIAQSLGLHYAWQREGKTLHFMFSRE